MHKEDSGTHASAHARGPSQEARDARRRADRNASGVEPAAGNLDAAGLLAAALASGAVVPQGAGNALAGMAWVALATGVTAGRTPAG
jgi:hypothetical protein